jgi:hypothetical protein
MFQINRHTVIRPASALPSPRPTTLSAPPSTTLLRKRCCTSAIRIGNHARQPLAFPWLARSQQPTRPSSSATTRAQKGGDDIWGSDAASMFSDDHLGPAFKATLKMLEWHKLCEHLADFANTFSGRRACLNLTVPATQAESERQLEETR